MPIDDSTTQPEKGSQTPTGQSQSAEQQVTGSGTTSDQPTSPHPSTHSVQKFLRVEVHKGSSTADIARALTEALHSKDVPFFAGSVAPPKASPEMSGEAKVQAMKALAAASPGTEYPEESLLILVTEEGP